MARHPRPSKDAVKAAADRAAARAEGRDPLEDATDPREAVDPLAEPVTAHARPVGRPPKFKPEYIAQARRLCAIGATDIEVADFFEINPATLYRWKNENDEFCESLKSGKEASDDRVERSLYQRATGFTYEATKVFMPAGATEPVYAAYREYSVPDTGAAMAWLKNRRPRDWKDRVATEVSGPGGAPIQIENTGDDLGQARKVAFALQRALERVQAQQQIEVSKVETDGN